MINWIMIAIIYLGLQFLLLLGFVWWLIRWNIPITLLRFTGNKGRPMLIQSRGRKHIKDGIPRLYVRGYKDPVRDYLAENYYPTGRGKYGGLILWEFEDGLLTPALPKKTVKGMSEREKKIYDFAREYFDSKPVTFDFDEQLYKDLKLKVVDDVDQEFMLQEQYRLEGQYSGGWKDFLMKYGGHFALIIIAVLMLVIVSKAPEFAATCADTARSIVQQSIIEQGVAYAQGSPAG